MLAGNRRICLEVSNFPIGTRTHLLIHCFSFQTANIRKRGKRYEMAYSLQHVTSPRAKGKDDGEAVEKRPDLLQYYLRGVIGQ